MWYTSSKFIISEVSFKLDEMKNKIGSIFIHYNTVREGGRAGTTPISSFPYNDLEK